MQRLFAGTPWDRPPTCDRCGRPEAECACPPTATPRKLLDPAGQTAHIRVEKRPKGKVVTVISNLDPEGNDLEALGATLKGKCGTGGTVKDGKIEVQGDHASTVESALTGLGYKTKRR